MTATRTFASVSEAVGYAAAVILHRGNIRKPKPTHGGPPPDDAAAMTVLQAMRTAGCPHGSDAGRAIVSWATAPDDVGACVDPTTRRLLTMALELAGLVRPPLEIPEFGWRVHRHANGRRLVTCVPDPDPRDTSVIRASSKSAALASKYLDVELLPSTNRPTDDEVRAEALAAIAAGSPVLDVDATIAARLRCSRRKAWTIRTGWQAEASQVTGAAAALGC
jgi:hypothetical protein